MFRSKLVKMVVALVLAVALGASVVACASNDENEETEAPDNWEAIESVAAEATNESEEAEETNEEEGGNPTGVEVDLGVPQFWQEEVDDPTEMFKTIVSDIPAFLATVPYFEDNYIDCCYYYFDYNHDGILEPIICAKYENDNNYVVNKLCYLYFDSENSVVAIKANVLDSQGTTILYCDYETYFTRVSFHADRSQPETWVYYVDIYENGNLCYIMAEEFMAGEYFTDPSEYGMTLLQSYRSGDLTAFETI